ncbi:MFS transporter [Brucella pseudogrignonensis]|uniref:MFS family permease n=1 Tax=Brucella pseudogrignonensis TaxID=419475 RepID=A0ABU1MDF5_9HYPH|nr:MFS transporter [Brucella pseudogrignonensis]MDR6433801.1 MFS family permease [Brucella pseudogrignonensis]
MPQRNSPLAPFQYGTFRALWSATLFSNLGGLVQTVGAGWMMATIAHSDDMVALVQASTTLPVMFFSVAAGALADNFDRRRIMLTAQIMLLVVSVALATFAYLGMLTPWMLLGFTFLIGCGGALHNPSWQASMGDIVPRTDLPAAVALNSMSFNLMRSIGPAIGGAIVAAAGAAFAFIFNAFSYIALILALWRWQPQLAKSTLPREAFGPAMVAGLRYVSMSPNLLKVMFRGFLFGLSAIVILALLPLVARDLVKGTALTYGIMLGFFGVGAIGGALLSARLRELLGNEWLVRGAFVAFAVSCALLSVSRSIWMSCIFLLPAGLSWVLALSLFNVTVQLSTPRWVVGRALAMYQTATFGGMAAGSWLWGSVADEFGVPYALLVASCVLLFGALVGLLLPQPDFESLNLDPLNRFSEPELRLDLRSRSGPIMIMVDYKIAQADVPAFLAAMALRRRIRIRDGARQWALLRDLENPETWTESYHVPTWVEYVRHNQRRTQSDAEVSERLLALHKGATPPLVHRMIERQTVTMHDDMPLKVHPDLT